MAKGKRGQVPERARCQGTSRQTGERCKRRRSPGSRFCIFHGGRAPKGPSHPNFRDGTRSRFLPHPSILAEHQRALEDRTLTHLRDAIALIDALINEELQSYAGGPSDELWAEVEEAWGRVQRARASGNPDRLRPAVEEVGRLIELGARRSASRKDLLRLMEVRRRVAFSETKRIVLEEGVYTPEQAATFIARVATLVKKYLAPADLVPFYNELTGITGERGVELPGDDAE